MSRLQKVLNILGQMPKKSQKAVLSTVDFDKRSPSENYANIIDAMIACAKSASQREMLEVYRDMRPTDDEVMEAFNGNPVESVTPLFFNEEQIDFISENVYRNRDGNFRLIPGAKHCSVERMPLEGLKADDDIIAARLSYTRVSQNGSSEEFNGLKELRKQPYDGPYDGVFLKLAPNLRRINIISSFEADDPHGFFKRGGQMYRNVCSQMSTVKPDMVTPEGLRRAMFLMFLVAGGREDDWKALYNLIHFMVRVPNSATGYVLYLNDFDAGGNGKSKFIGLLDRMFGESFTAFSTQQLRFTISLLGKRLVSISEFEDSGNLKELQSLIKSMTGRDRFQYEGKGIDPIVAETYQNFVISSNKYMYFEDSGIKRRMQNFHCSNLLHVMMSRYTHDQEYLNPLFGNVFNGESMLVQQEMAHSLLDYILHDERPYSIPLRPQSIVLGSLRNPVLRALFSPRANFDGFCMETQAGTRMDLLRLAPDAKPEQLNYACTTVQSWLSDVVFVAGRGDNSLTTSLPMSVLKRKFEARLVELEAKSTDLRCRTSAKLEKCECCGFKSDELFTEYMGDVCRKYCIPVRQSEHFIEVGDEK